MEVKKRLPKISTFRISNAQDTWASPSGYRSSSLEVGKSFSIPTTVEARCTGLKETGDFCFEGKKVVSLGEGSPTYWLKCVGKPEKHVDSVARQEAGRMLRCAQISIGTARENQTVTCVVVYPDFQELGRDKETGNIVDELGRDWKRVDAVYLGAMESKARPYFAQGTVVAHLQTQEITPVIDRLESMDFEDEALEPVLLSYEELESVGSPWSVSQI